jgi:HAD superfamily hydrolase (TIGR01459 family)
MSRQITSRPVALLDGLQPVAGRYDVVLCDVWGVVHNGLAAYEAASDALMRFRAKGGCVVLVSNAPRPGSAVALQLDRLGVPRGAYDAIVTSGDLTRAKVEERIGQVLHHIGPPRDLPLFEGLPVRFGSLEEADYAVCSGFDAEDEGRESVEVYRPRLEAMRRRDLWMLCANPDLVVERGDTLIPCAGAIAQLYESVGGEVYYAGKPHRPIYEQALAAAAKHIGATSLATDRVLAIGDAIRTDIAGAVGFGLDSILVARGIHAEELRLHVDPLDSESAQDWLALQDVQPKAVMERLVWSSSR